MWISRKMEKSHAAQLNYMAAQCKQSVLNYVREVAGPAAGPLKINHTNHPCMNSVLEAASASFHTIYALFLVVYTQIHCIYLYVNLIICGKQW